jgi:tetratricopeptide (TPR) repeat protein
MSTFFDDTHRQVIPRWLSFATSCALGVLRHKPTNTGSTQATSESFTLARQAWQTIQNIPNAVDLTAAAMISDERVSQDATRAAKFILAETPQTATIIRNIATHYLTAQQDVTINTDIGAGTTQLTHGQIARLRRELHENPRDPISWCDLALCYGGLGLSDKAAKTMEIALALGRQNRFILRSATRCFLHSQDPEKALHLLQQSPLRRTDPWIAAAEIAVAERIGKRSVCLPHAALLTTDDNWSLYARSELAAAIATVEYKEGAGKKGKQLLRMALMEPTENALAQGEWLVQRKNIPAHHQTKVVPAAFEADARTNFRLRKFPTSYDLCVRWSNFQPFSASPIVMASFIASVCMNDDAKALEALQAVACLHRRNTLFLNNYAFALARTNALIEARNVFRTIDVGSATPMERCTIAATEGFFQFRAGDKVKAREYYRWAVEGFEANGQQRSAAIATYYWASEEARLATEMAPAVIGDAKARIKKQGVFELEDQMKSLDRQTAKKATRVGSPVHRGQP